MATVLCPASKNVNHRRQPGASSWIGYVQREDFDKVLTSMCKAFRRHALGNFLQAGIPYRVAQYVFAKLLVSFVQLTSALGSNEISATS